MAVYVGIGGWVFEEWRDNFYPKDLSQKKELEYASRHLTAIEVNGTIGSAVPCTSRTGGRERNSPASSSSPISRPE